MAVAQVAASTLRDSSSAAYMLSTASVRHKAPSVCVAIRSSAATFGVIAVTWPSSAITFSVQPSSAARSTAGSPSASIGSFAAASSSCQRSMIRARIATL